MRASRKASKGKMVSRAPLPSERILRQVSFTPRVTFAGFFIDFSVDFSGVSLSFV